MIKTDKLIKKAEMIFGKSPEILTGQGLNRTELRILEREKMIEKEKGYLKSSGQIIYKWRLNPSIQIKGN